MRPVVQQAMAWVLDRSVVLVADYVLLEVVQIDMEPVPQIRLQRRQIGPEQEVGALSQVVVLHVDVPDRQLVGNWVRVFAVALVLWVSFLGLQLRLAHLLDVLRVLGFQRLLASQHFQIGGTVRVLF